MRFLLMVLLLTLPALADGAPLQVFFWNLESPGHADDPGNRPGADISFLAERIARDFAGADLAGFEEVDPGWPPELEKALERANPGRDFRVSTTMVPRYDRITLAYDAGRFERLDGDGPPQEVPGIFGPFGMDTFRPAAYLRLRDRTTGRTLLFMGNHLARSKGDKGVDIRRQQAGTLRDWTRGQQDPVIMGGDFNFDLPLDGSDPEQGFTTLTSGNHLRWARPQKLEETTRHGDILDFIFAGQAARDWATTARILPNDYLPVDRNSDHRPIWAGFEIP